MGFDEIAHGTPRLGQDARASVRTRGARAPISPELDAMRAPCATFTPVSNADTAAFRAFWPRAATAASARKAASWQPTRSPGLLPLEVRGRALQRELRTSLNLAGAAPLKSRRR